VRVFIEHLLRPSVRTRWRPVGSNGTKARQDGTKVQRGVLDNDDWRGDHHFAQLDDWWHGEP
jgi:hypothetical protein